MKNLTQRDRRDGILIEKWPVGSDGYLATTAELNPRFTSGGECSSLADFQNRLESGNEFVTAGFLYRVE